MLFLACFVGLSATSGAAGIVAFTLGVIALFGWIGALAFRCTKNPVA